MCTAPSPSAKLKFQIFAMHSKVQALLLTLLLKPTAACVAYSGYSSLSQLKAALLLHAKRNESAAVVTKDVLRCLMLMFPNEFKSWPD